MHISFNIKIADNSVTMDLSKVVLHNLNEWPPIEKIAAHSNYVIFLSISA